MVSALPSFVNVRRAFVILLLLGTCACSTRTPHIIALPETLTEERALALAEQHVRAIPSRSEYKMTDIRYDTSFRAWVVRYSRGPRVGFGDHNWFGVKVTSPTEISEIWE